MLTRGCLNMEQVASFKAAFTGTLTFLSYSGVPRIALISCLGALFCS